MKQWMTVCVNIIYAKTRWIFEKKVWQSMCSDTDLYLRFLLHILLTSQRLPHICCYLPHTACSNILAFLFSYWFQPWAAFSSRFCWTHMLLATHSHWLMWTVSFTSLSNTRDCSMPFQLTLLISHSVENFYPLLLPSPLLYTHQLPPMITGLCLTPTYVPKLPWDTCLVITDFYSFMGISSSYYLISCDCAGSQKGIWQ